MPEPSSAPADSITQLYGAFQRGLTSEQRLFELQGEGELGELLPEAFSLREGLSQVWELHLSALSLRADLDLQAMLGRRLVLRTVLADGHRAERSGVVLQASSEVSDGGLARYRLVLRPWLALLACTRRSQVWQACSLVQIVESVFRHHAAHAAWAWAADTADHLQRSPFADAQGLRSYTVQYRESDLAFVSRLLAEEGLAFRFEEDPAAPLGHRLVILADTPRRDSTPEDATSAHPVSGPGIRFHRAASVEEQDTVQALGSQRHLQAARTTVLSWDPLAKAALAASVPTVSAFAGPNAPRLESYDAVGAGAFSTMAQAERAALLGQQALEARHKRWLGRSTVRTFMAGTRFELTQSELDLLDGLNDLDEADDLDTGHGPASRTSPGRKGRSASAPCFLLLQITHAGLNKLPTDLTEQVQRRLRRGGPALLEPWVDDDLRRQAQATGYANHFEAQRAHVPWRPLQADGTGARLNPKPTAPDFLTATVVGPQGETQPRGADEIHTDALGRVRIRFDFQAEGLQGPETSQSSTWVRVLMRWAGAGLGLQFIPRIGQEVLVAFVDNDIDRPLVCGAFYNGRGEGGVPPTPGGEPAEADDSSVFAHSTDHRPAGQGNLSGGHSPAWHGAAGASVQAGGQDNAAALSGFKSKEFGGIGFNQLVFDDTPGQSRVQLATTQHATQLNLGHLIHQADNHRGSLRGTGFELRTDAYGVLRGGRGVLLTTYATQPGEPAGDNAAGIALLGQLKTLAATFNQAARTHQTVALASHQGSTAPGQSALSDTAAPLQALHTALKGMVDASRLEQALQDAADRCTTPATGDVPKVPHTSDPVLAVSARAGLAVAAGQDLQWAVGEGLTLGAGEDLHLATGGAMRLHTGQTIGMLGGAVQPGTEAAGTGFTMIAGQGDIDLQAQASTAQVAARDELSIQSQSAHIDWAAARKIVLRTAGGASLTLAGGHITVECPGKISIQASVKRFSGPQRLAYPLPVMPRDEPAPQQLNFSLVLRDMPGAHGRPLAGRDWKVVVLRAAPPTESGAASHAAQPKHWRDTLAGGVSDADGACLLTDDQKRALWNAVGLHPDKVWLVSGANATPIGFASLSTDAGDREQRKTLDALNFTPTAEVQSDDPTHMHRVWAERDFVAPLMAAPQSDTQA